MFVRAIGNYPPYRNGQCFEIHDRIGGPLIGSILEVVTAADVRAYELAMAAIDRCIDAKLLPHSRITGTPRSAAAPVDPVCHPRAPRGRRAVTQDEWRREIGQDQQGYWSAALAHRQSQELAQPSCRHHS